MLSANDLDDPLTNYFDCFGSAGRKSEELALDTRLDCEIRLLRFDEGVKDTLAKLVDDDDSSDVLFPCRCRVSLDRET